MEENEEEIEKSNGTTEGAGALRTGPGAALDDDSDEDSGYTERAYGAPERPRERVFSAVYSEARERGLTERDALAMAEDICDRLRLEEPTEYEDSDPRNQSKFYDLRSEQDYIYPGDKDKVRFASPKKRIPVRRDPKTVTSIVIHQTACEYGVSDRAVALASGDTELARARLALDVACHALAFRNGYFVAAHDLDVFVNHANRLNDQSLGLEIEGRYPGLMDDPSTLPREDLDTTWGGPPSYLTEATVKAARAALRWLVFEGRKLGMPIEFIYAHRQSSDSRRSDPGEELWNRVVLEYGVRVLGLKTRPHTTWRNGYSIPEQWDPDGGKGEY